MEYIQSLTSWINKLPLTSIKFMYFNASNLTTPKVKTAFKQFQIESDNYYITEGITRNFWYIYYESILKYLVQLKLPIDTNCLIYDVDIIANIGNSEIHDVNHGDHIDFGILRLKDGSAVVKTHKTVYSDILGDFKFDRTADRVCNFVFKKEYLSNFDNIKAEYKDGTNGSIIKNIYIEKDLNIIKHLCTIMSTKKQNTRQQSGGKFLASENIISKYIIKPLYEKRPDLLEVRIIHKDKENKIIVLIDFIEYTRSILIVRWPIIESYTDDIISAISQLKI